MLPLIAHCSLLNTHRSQDSTAPYSNPLHYIHMWFLFHAPLYWNVGCPSSTSSLDRWTLKTASYESNHCLALWKSARHLVSQTPSYSTDNTTSHSSVALRQIWTNGTYSIPMNKQGHNCGSEIFRAMKAIKAKGKSPAAKAIAKIKVLHCIDDPNV